MRTQLLRRLGAVGLVGLAVLAVSACGSDSRDETANRVEPATVRSYVGTAQGSDAFVGVVVDGKRALAYVCDGVPGEPGAPPTVQAWFNGPLMDGAIDVSQAGGRLELRVRDDDVTGTLTLAAGRRLPVTGRVVQGDAGLYRAEAQVADGKAVAGWILSSDGQQRGGLGVESGGTTKLSGTQPLILSQPTINLQGLAAARIAKVGITPIPIP